MELDLYGSYTGSITDALGYAVGVITYNYPIRRTVWTTIGMRPGSA